MDPLETEQVNRAMHSFVKELASADKEKSLRLSSKIAVLNDLDTDIGLSDHLQKANEEMLAAKTVVLHISDIGSSEGRSAYKTYKSKKVVYFAILKATQEDVQQEPVVEVKDETKVPDSDDEDTQPNVSQDTVRSDASKTKSEKTPSELLKLAERNLKRWKKILSEHEQPNGVEETLYKAKAKVAKYEAEVAKYEAEVAKYEAEIERLNPKVAKKRPLAKQADAEKAFKEVFSNAVAGATDGDAPGPSESKRARKSTPAKQPQNPQTAFTIDDFQQIVATGCAGYDKSAKQWWQAREARANIKQIPKNAELIKEKEEEIFRLQEEHKEWLDAYVGFIEMLIELSPNNLRRLKRLNAKIEQMHAEEQAEAEQDALDEKQAEKEAKNGDPDYDSGSDDENDEFEESDEEEDAEEEEDAKPKADVMELSD